ncbi:dienelactone hydrolase [Colletotrichum godetiae]|uniref:Dienelactone hydrolase n=1 Tax=Colletotrichum godetiae TaxID=1209918 RepID=A0AAJ0F201_9PEZI|nr:dienelactone hydrolase [Colletotrichum godetiae]KAK1690028.1 dienelactone hydrolase [Colletotrichum godetiae]
MRYLYAVSAIFGLVSLAESRSSYVADLSILAYAGTPVGKVVPFNGLDLYVSMPRNKSEKGPDPMRQFGVLMLPDVFGIQSNENMLLADSFARAGYITVAPDLMDGKPRTEGSMTGFNASEFFKSHGPSVTDPKVEKAIMYMREQMGVRSIASTGYCFGGRYVFRALGLPNKKGVQVGFAAHPSALGDDEIMAIKGPASLAVAEGDTGMLTKRRVEIETAMGTTGQPFTMALYGGTPHGFATHPDLNNPVQKAAKEDAFLQAVRFFETWL